MASRELYQGPVILKMDTKKEILVTRLVGILGFVLSLSSSAISAPPPDSLLPPTPDQISHWLSSPPGLTVSNITPVRLVEGEDAVLCSATFADEGRNSMFGAVLARPKIEQAVRLNEVGYNFQIVDLDGDGISEILTDLTGSGQGTMMGLNIFSISQEMRRLYSASRRYLTTLVVVKLLDVEMFVNLWMRNGCWPQHLVKLQVSSRQ